MPAPVAYPLGPPVIADNVLTVDTALNQPTRITRRIADITLQRFIVARIFALAGGVSGGAVVYDQAVANELFTARDVERVAPGDEFPLVTSTRTSPKVAEVEKWGGKFFVTDEARKRNQQSLFDNQVTQLANTIERKVNARAVAELEAAITALGGAGTFVGENWGAVITAGTSASSNAEYPAADFAKAQMLADTDELGVTYDLWLLNPMQRMQLAIVYGDKLAAVLDSFNIEVFASNRVPSGTAYAVARNQVGELRVEAPLATEVWREQKNQRTWVQSSVRPVMYVTNPYSIKKVTGLNG